MHHSSLPHQEKFWDLTSKNKMRKLRWFCTFSKISFFFLQILSTVTVGAFLDKNTIAFSHFPKFKCVWLISNIYHEPILWSLHVKLSLFKSPLKFEYSESNLVLASNNEFQILKTQLFSLLIPDQKLLNC